MHLDARTVPRHGCPQLAAVPALAGERWKRSPRSAVRVGAPELNIPRLQTPRRGALSRDAELGLKVRRVLQAPLPESTTDGEEIKAFLQAGLEFFDVKGRGPWGASQRFTKVHDAEQRSYFVRQGRST